MISAAASFVIGKACRDAQVEARSARRPRQTASRQPSCWTLAHVHRVGLFFGLTRNAVVHLAQPQWIEATS
jgi:hypothetical protein